MKFLSYLAVAGVFFSTTHISANEVNAYINTNEIVQAEQEQSRFMTEEEIKVFINEVLTTEERTELNAFFAENGSLHELINTLQSNQKFLAMGEILKKYGKTCLVQLVVSFVQHPQSIMEIVKDEEITATFIPSTQTIIPAVEAEAETDIA